jgi:hypothetical protein
MEVFVQVVESMEVSQFINGGLMPYHDEGWIFIGQSSFAKSAYLNSIRVPSQMNMLVTVSLHNRINLLCKIAAGLQFLQANSRARVCHCIQNGNGIFLLVCGACTMLICITCTAPSSGRRRRSPRPVPVCIEVQARYWLFSKSTRNRALVYLFMQRWL